MDGSAWDAVRAVYEQGDIFRDRPDVGKLVKVIAGRKHLGDTGRVVWHGRDRFYTGYRYQNDFQMALHDAIGRIGFRIKIVTDSGEEFFVSADYVEVQS